MVNKKDKDTFEDAFKNEKRDHLLTKIGMIIFFITTLVFAYLVSSSNDQMQVPKCIDKQVSIRVHYYFGCVENCRTLKSIETFSDRFDSECAQPCFKESVIYAEDWVEQMYNVGTCEGRERG